MCGKGFAYCVVSPAWEFNVENCGGVRFSVAKPILVMKTQLYRKSYSNQVSQRRGGMGWRN